MSILRSMWEVMRMPDVTTPSRKDKLQLIEDMGIDIMTHCPSSFGLKDRSNGFCCINIEAEIVCPTCWIKALEG